MAQLNGKTILQSATVLLKANDVYEEGDLRFRIDESATARNVDLKVAGTTIVATLEGVPVSVDYAFDFGGTIRGVPIEVRGYVHLVAGQPGTDALYRINYHMIPA